MPLHYTWKKVITGALAVTLIGSSSAAVLGADPVAIYANQAAAKQATPFTDVAAGHWAEKHIAKLSLQGIINGYQENNDTFTFRPERSITQQEAVIMALRFAGLANQIDEHAMIQFTESFVVDNFYKPYIQLAFEQGLLDRDEEYQIAEDDSSKAWGSRPASREWVTKLIVKAIGEEAVAKQLQNTESRFSDAGAMDSKYIGFINAATQLGLVKGLSEDRFGPKSNINRASLATLFSRAQGHIGVEYTGQESGVISNLTEDKITLYANGKETEYSLSDATAYYHYNSESASSKEQLLEYGDVTIIARDGVARYVEVEGDVQHIKPVNGTVVHYNEAEKLLYVLVDEKPVEFKYDPSIVIENEEGTTLQISDLKRDRQVVITSDTFREEPRTISIVASSAPVVTTAKGLLYEFNNKIVTIQDDTGFVTKFLAPNTVVTIEGLNNAKLDDLLIEKDNVELSLNEKDQVTAIKVVNRQVETLAGYQAYYNEKLPEFITVSDAFGKQAKVLYFSGRTKFNYFGNNMEKDTALKMLNQNVNVTVSYTHDEIVSLNFVNSYTGEMVRWDTNAKTITMRLDGGEEVVLPYTNAPVYYKGRPAASIGDMRQGEKVTVSLNFTKVEASAIRVHVTEQFQVTAVDIINKKITMKNATTKENDYMLLDAELLTAAGGKQTINQIKVGSTVDATFVGDELKKLQTVNTSSNG
ncbi:S-layer homology domain-containing protein [Paenibacillus sp. IITD108]|uniref:S-layer homology domain-containing protein n=1 Tax=Paenibacillus sp. IITD108 TaxID=3116649 RepID=UPI002F3FC188